MVSSSLIQYLLSDNDSLLDYENCVLPTFEDVKRRLLLLKRQENRDIPDHYYRLNQSRSFEGIESLSSTIRLGLYRLADEHLELRGNRIYVKQHKQNNWQELITYIPPLILQMAFLHLKKPLTDTTGAEIIDYYRDIILPNTKYTSLPYPFIPQVRSYIRENSGFMDLHIHLNGTTEVDSVWQDFLTYPDKLAEDISQKINEPLVKEQLEQEYFLRTPKQFRDLFVIARHIRQYLFDTTYYGKNHFSNGDVDTPRDLLCKIVEAGSNSVSNERSSVFHPFADLVLENSVEVNYPMAVEGLMYMLVFKYMSEEDRDSVAYLFHFYILILGLSNRLLVQQKHQVGFQQFQKLTVNNLREESERLYKKRFFQLHGNEQCNISFIEGRFSPKATEDENIDLIQTIFRGWNSLKNQLINELDLTEDKLPELKLIAHFIKKKDNENSIDVRHQELRYDVWIRARALAHLKDKHYDLIQHLVGIDAAASEFDTPPEVFAPAFRYLKRKGFEHFTYHAGEDFFHILGGMRAIYEAVKFNELSAGNRIGHATAIGLSSAQWLQNVGNKLLVKQGEYLDDLLFAYHLILESNNSALKGKIPYLVHKIEELSYTIYQKSFPIKIQEEAWLMRRFCPKLLFAESQDVVINQEYFDSEEWYQIQLETKGNLNDERVELLQRYHSDFFREEYEKILEIDTDEFFSASELEMLQLELLSVLHKKEIVIETLPSSNVRIGHHHNYDTYHLWNWMNWEKEGKCIPPIVVGTDDAGIFATNIYNEYANIYCNLTNFHNIGHNDAMEVIKKLDNNAKVYKFS